MRTRRDLKRLMIWRNRTSAKGPCWNKELKRTRFINSRWLIYHIRWLREKGFMDKIEISSLKTVLRPPKLTDLRGTWKTLRTSLMKKRKRIEFKRNHRQCLGQLSRWELEGHSRFQEDSSVNNRHLICNNFLERPRQELQLRKLQHHLRIMTYHKQRHPHLRAMLTKRQLRWRLQAQSWLLTNKKIMRSKKLK